MYLLKLILDFDQKMVDRLENLCHRQQRLTGISHYFWLQLIAVANAILFFVMMPSPKQVLTNMPGWMGIIVLLILSFVFPWWENKSLARLEKGFSNPLRKYGVAIYVRISHGYFATTYLLLTLPIATLLFQPEFFWISFGIIVWWITLMFMYVLPACDPLPPTTGKLKKMILSIFLNPAST